MNVKKYILIILTGAFLFTPHTAQSKAAWTGMVSFNFDDGHKSVYENALPVFKKYQIVGSIFPVVGAIEDQEDWIVTWPQLSEFQAAGWEVGSHTMTHPHLTTLSAAQVDYELGESQRILAEHGIIAKTLVFPYNSYNSLVLDYTTRYYENSRTVGEFNGFDCNRYLIVCKEVSAATTPEEAIAWIQEAVQKKMWLVLMMHEIVTGPPAGYQYNVADLEKIVTYVAAHNIPAPNMQEALARRQADLGPNLIANPNLEYLDPFGWAIAWSRNNASQVSVEPAPVARVFSSGNRLKIVGSPQKNIASTNIIELPDYKPRFFFSFFAAVTNAGQDAEAEIYLDEFDANGQWLGGQWLGGFYEDTWGLPGYLYQPSSHQVRKIMIDIYTIPGANITIWGDNFYFGFIKRRKHLPAIVNILLTN
ncbi:MAG: polysaccharide deacetylase family protein [Syntrophales bacterium]|nr:polysaccharide deacetylase family protein [Syntrophales bacterium]